MNAPDVTVIKPLLRGWSHGLAALVSVAGLVALVAVTRDDPAKLVSMLVYGTGLVLLFGISGTYHIFNWPPRVKNWLRRADHATIFVFIAATYTPLVFNVLDGWWRTVVLTAIWICAAAGVAGAALAGGPPRPPSQTPSELLASLPDDPGLPPGVLGEAGIVVRTFELVRFGDPARRPDDDAVERAHQAAARVRELTRR